MTEALYQAIFEMRDLLEAILAEQRWQHSAWVDTVCLNCGGYGYIAYSDAPNELCPVCKGTRIATPQPTEEGAG